MTTSEEERGRDAAVGAMKLGDLGTEAPNSRTVDLDTMSTILLLSVMNAEDRSVPLAVERVLPAIARAVDVIVQARRRGGRLIYVGAGTSGRIGLLDAVECPPTFGTDPGEVVGLIAGGDNAFIQAVEGAEDDAGQAVIELQALRLTDADVVVGIAASGRTPYVIGALTYARSLAASTISIACNRHAPISALADIAIEIDTGPEVLTGSTRLKAGTAQKLVCNMLSTASMVQTGKVYGNLMVDVRPTNAKLVDRSIRIVAAAAEVDFSAAKTALQAADGHAKTAIVMLLTACSPDEARRRLASHGGRVREATALA